MARYNIRDCWMVEELRREREASQLDIEEITNFISGNEALTERRREICELCRSTVCIVLSTVYKF